MTPRKMGSGPLWRVRFGAQPHGSPMRHKRKSGCSLFVVAVLAGTTAGLTVASVEALGLTW